MKRILILLFLVSRLILINGQETITIGILDEKQNSESDILFEKLKQEISAVLGKERIANFSEVMYNDFDLRIAENNYNNLLSNETDIIISFGVVNTIMLYNKESYPIPIIIVGAVNNDLANIPKDQTASGINNLTYLVTPFSYNDDLDAFASIYAFDNIGIVFDNFMLELLPLKELFDEYFEEKAVNYKFIEASNKIISDSLLNNLDAVYLSSFSTLSVGDQDKLIEEINILKLPSLSGYGVKDVERGVLATNQPAINMDQIFRRIALNVESISNNVNASELPLFIDYTKGLSINMATAEQIGFPIRNSMLAYVNLIEGTKTVTLENQYSLVDVMNGVITNNLTLEADRKNINLSEQDVKSSKSQYYPNINASASGTYIDPKAAEISIGQNPELSTSGNLSLDQVVYSEQATANISVQKNILEAQKQDYNSFQLDALLEAAIAYFNALILKTNVSIQNQNLQLTRQNLGLANDNMQLGASGKADVLRFQSQLAQNTQSMIEARNSLNQAYFQINQLLNNPISFEIDIQDTVIDRWTNENKRYEYFKTALDDPSQKERLVSFFIEEARRNAPELKSIDFNTEVVRRIYRLNDKGRFVPTVSLFGGYDHLFSRSGVGSETPEGFPVAPDGSYNVGLNVSLPIFNQNIRNIDRQTSKIQEEQLILQKENIELSIEKNINDIVLDLVNELANIEISAFNLEVSEESLELTQSEYRNGAIPVIQLIDAQNNYLQAFLANATAKYTYLLVTMQLQRVIGYFFEMNTEASNQEFIQRANQFILNNNQ